MTVRSWAAALSLVAAAAPAAGQPPADAPRYTVFDGRPGVSTFAPRRWGAVGTGVANPGDAPADLTAAHYFGGDPATQFARHLWVPPRAKRTSWHPVLPPAGKPPGNGLPVTALLVDRSRGREVLVGGRGTGLAHAGLLPARPDTSPVTGLLADPDDPEPALLVQAARASLLLSPRLARLGGDGLPPVPDAYQALDQLALGTDRAADDPAGLLALRAWLHAGGRAWARLDRVAPDTVALLTGEPFPGTVVGRVGLTRWEVVRSRASADPDEDAYDAPPAGGPADRTAGAVGDFDPPVEMVRVLLPGVRPTHSVDGWPAAFWLRAGRGAVLCTTLGPRAWVVPQKNAKPGGDPLNPVAGLEPTGPLRQLALAFLKLREGPPLAADAFGPLLEGQVGRPVVARAAVLGVLGAFCLALAAGGAWLGVRGDLAHLGWAGPAAGVAAAGLLAGLGHLTRGGVPPTVAEAQFVEATPGADDAAVTGLMAVYAPDGSAAPLGSRAGGAFVPEPPAGSATTRRMVRTDLDRWHWENAPLAPGLHRLPFEATARLAAPASARLTFGPAGVTGRVEFGSFGEAADAVLALPSRRHFAVRPAGGAFVAGPADQLAPGQFLAGGVLTDEQRRRQAVYRQLLDRKDGPRYPARPTLLAWAGPLDLGFDALPDARRAGSALVAVPAAVERPAAGTRVLVPGPFLPYRGLTGPGLALLYNPSRNEWLAAQSRPSRTLLRFQVPVELLPVRTVRAALEIDVNAPGRTLEVFAAGGAVLATRPSPVGRLRVEIGDPDVLRPDAGGGVRVGLGVAGGGAEEWAIRDVQMELVGDVE